jgi:cell division protein FtsB
MQWLRQRAVNRKIEKKIELYKKNTQELEKRIETFETCRDSVEKYAREHYCMKFENEDVFIFE